MAELFSRTARPAILAASRSQRLRRTAERLPITRRVVHRFVPGETVPAALHTAAALRDSGRMVSIDYLGEDITEADDATKTVNAYQSLLQALGERSDAAAEGIAPLEVSLKLSALGQALPRDGEKIALENAHTVCGTAQQLGVWVTVDAEDHTTTDSTLGIVRELRCDFPWLGTVLQAYLRRTYGDCEQFAASGARIRLCKGAYDESVSVAYRDSDEVTASYLRCLAVLMDGSGYPMVASHDPVIIDAAGELAGAAGRGPREFEYQMLYGIRADEQRRLADTGAGMRVYVPFGDQWYGYLVRRLAERPANLGFFLRALAERR
ncbi:MAG: proline dehydrogenase family protein [Mycobacteriaceae bacterium]|nr:proline dehydrogenase family protein [Mycobacteriaceae bacterium]